MRAAYILASAFWQVSILGGGATFTYLSGDWPWIAGAIVLALLGDIDLAAKMKKWEGKP